MSAQLALCGQDPETALNSALASVNFYLQQQQLYFEFREAQLQKKITKVQEACKKKLQEVHTGYTAVSLHSVNLLQQCYQLSGRYQGLAGHQVVCSTFFVLVLQSCMMCAALRLLAYHACSELVVCRQHLSSHKNLL